MTALLHAARAALQWRLLLLWLAALALPAALFALPVWATLSAQLDHSVHAPALARALDMIALTDLADALRRDGTALTTAGMGALALTLLLSPLLTGAAITAARAHETLRMRELLAGAGEQYPRLFRMLVWAAVPLGAAFLLGGVLADGAAERVRTAVTCAEARPWQIGAAAGAAALMLLAHVTVDLGRAALALDRRRTSAVAAWWRGLGMLVREPGGVLAAWFVPTALGLLLAALLAFGRVHVPALGPAGTVGALLLAQAIVAVLAWMRIARLFALVALARRQAGPAQLH